jgi:uncharacterized protein (TIGR00369 family)
MTMNAPHVAFREWFKTVEGDTLPRPPIAELLGFDVRIPAEGEAIATIQTDSRLANPMGTLHGGVLADVSDAAMGCALASTLGAGESFTTIELKVNFFKPIWNARLEARATIVRRTRALAYLECDVKDEGGSLVARTSSTCMILRGHDAAGR